MAQRPLPAQADPKKRINETLRLGLYRKLGADVTAMAGIGTLVGLTCLTAAGPDLRCCQTEWHFPPGLGRCPDHRISGGKVLSGRTRRVVNRRSNARRLAATTLEHRPTALGADYRRRKGKLGAAERITATAHKLARLRDRLSKHGEPHVRQRLADDEQKHQMRKLKGRQKAAASIGFELVPQQPLAPCVS